MLSTLEILSSVCSTKKKKRGVWKRDVRQFRQRGLCRLTEGYLHCHTSAASRSEEAHEYQP